MPLLCFLFCSVLFFSILCFCSTSLFPYCIQNILWLTFGLYFRLLVRFNWLFIVFGSPGVQFAFVLCNYLYLRWKRGKAKFARNTRESRERESIQLFLQTVRMGPLILAYGTMNGIVLVSDNCFGQIASIPIIYYIFSVYLIIFTSCVNIMCVYVGLSEWVYVCVCVAGKGGTPCSTLTLNSYEMPKQLPFWYFSLTSFCILHLQK